MYQLNSVYKVGLAIYFFLTAAYAQSSQNPSKEDKEFQQKIETLLVRTDKSIKLLREQITDSQTAPFLPDLYVQLAELLSQKSSALYYVQMERQKNSATSVPIDQQFSPVVAAQKEAIQVYRTVLLDFKDYSKRRDVLFRLASAYKSIDEAVEFVRTAGQLIQEYSDSDDAMRARLLLGQHYFDMQAFDDAAQFLEPVSKSALLYESHLAIYRLGLINIAREKAADALHQFEQVISSKQLQEQENPYAVTLKKRGAKSDLRREALIDSIRAFTQVYAENANPVEYYSKLAPNEVYFQEVIEKLSLRYISLKKYDAALSLLRTLSERLTDPQKVINIYQEVLMLIPPERRIDIPVHEMKYVLNRYALWVAYYKVPTDTYAKSYFFFEKHLRELGTTGHALAKDEQNAERKLALYKRAEGYYQLYLSFFSKSENSVKLAIDLADTYYQIGDFLSAGNVYLQTYMGDYGNPLQKELLLENALLSLQKKGNLTFYQNLRMRGLLIKALQTAIASDKKYALDPKTNLLLLKTEYEQGFFPETLEKLYLFAQKYSKTLEASDAGELILDYFNVRNDYQGLQYWTDRLIGLKLQAPEFNQKLASIKTQTSSKLLQEKARATSGYDEFAQGRSFLNIAESSSDRGIAEAALQEALTKSRAERDIQTFIQAASLLSKKETDPQKKFDILKSIALEYFRMTRYFSSFQPLESILQDKQIATKNKYEAAELLVKNSLLLRDWESLKRYLVVVNPRSLTPSTQQRLKEILIDILESPAAFPAEFGAPLLAIDSSDDTMLSFYKGQSKLSVDTIAKIETEIRTRCGKPNSSVLCKWTQLESLEQRRIAQVEALKTAGTTLDNVQMESQNFMNLINAYQGLYGSGDAALESIIAIREIQIYSSFSDYLKRTANANPDVGSVLTEKAEEASKNAKGSLDRCKAIQTKSAILNPIGRHCDASNGLTTKELLRWSPFKTASPTRLDPTTEKIQDLQSQVFFSKDPTDAFLTLAKEYLDQGHLFHAVATATLGIGTYPAQKEKYEAILGCGVLELGFFSESFFHLSRAEDYAGLKTRCLTKLEQQKAIK